MNTTKIESESDDTFFDPNYFPSCEIGKSKNALFSVCEECSAPICEDHVKYSCLYGHKKDIRYLATTLPVLQKMAKMNTEIDIHNN